MLRQPSTVVAVATILLWRVRLPDRPGDVVIRVVNQGWPVRLTGRAEGQYGELRFQPSDLKRLAQLVDVRGDTVAIVYAEAMDDPARAD